MSICQSEGERNTSNGAADEQHDDDEDELRTFNFEIIAAAATNYFATANKIGEGGFAPVYKASNVLPDDDMNPKISDFGMATILGLRIRSKHRVGYMSPEYALHGVVSTKTNVFSFGILLLEIVSGKKNNGFYDPDEKLSTLAGYTGLLCVQDQATDRPAMSEVVALLSNETRVLAHPKQPSFCAGEVAEELAKVEIE
ncbi:unnamed protein product, partial [Linum tenue]